MEHKKPTTGYSLLSKIQDDLICTQRLVIQKQQELLKSYKGILKSKGIIKQKRFTDKEKSDLIQIVECSQKSKMSLLKELGINRGSYYYWKQEIELKGKTESLSEIREHKYQKEEYIESLFSILHAPPKDYGFNRTSWRLPDIHTAMKAKGLPPEHNYICKVIKNTGYRFRSAKGINEY